MRKVALSIIGFLALAGVVGYVATMGRMVGGGGAAGAPMASGAARAGPVHSVVGDEGFAPLAQPKVNGGAAAILPAIGNGPAIGPDIVKTASISIQVQRDGFGSAFDQATTVAGKYGGYVQDSSSRGTTARSGELTIRVPASSFELAMNDLRHLGTVQAQSVSGQDVTSQFVDLNARLRTWQAQEAVLLRLMRSATSIESTLRVQNQLQDVQFRIEQIKGQLRVLENQTSLATIDLSLREIGAPVPSQQVVANDRPSLAEAWQRALNGFLGVIFAVVVGLGYLLPLAAIGFGIWLGYRRLRPRAAAAS